jgi:energy-coupling factor transport system substrate-specific component
MNNQLDTKNLINVGMFSVIYIILVFMCNMLGIIPLFLFITPFIAAIAGGTPYMLYLTKVKKMGMVTITGLLVGLFFFIIGHGWPVLLVSILCGLSADIVLKYGNYTSWKHTLLSYSIFSLCDVGTMLPIWLIGKKYAERYRDRFGDLYVDTILLFTNKWTLSGVIVLCIIGAIMGAYLGRSILKRHFQKAGIV